MRKGNEIYNFDRPLLHQIPGRVFICDVLFNLFNYIRYYRVIENGESIILIMVSLRLTPQCYVNVLAVHSHVHKFNSTVHYLNSQ